MTDTDESLVKPPAQTCPECGGAMIVAMQGTLTRFRCHIGHVMTAEIVAAAQALILERSLDVVLRTLNERVALCGDMAEKFAASGDDDSAERWAKAADEAEGRALAIRELTQVPWTHPETISDAEAEALSGSDGRLG
jgi:two-component system chemotaxis response regulator CheB